MHLVIDLYFEHFDIYDEALHFIVSLYYISIDITAILNWQFLNHYESALQFLNTIMIML